MRHSESKVIVASVAALVGYLVAAIVGATKGCDHGDARSKKPSMPAVQPCSQPAAMGGVRCDGDTGQWRRADDDAVRAMPAVLPVAAGGRRLVAAGPGIGRLLDAIRQVETGNRPNPPAGDGGRSRGPYQIQLGYWLDAGGTAAGYYRSVGDDAGCRAIISMYWRRHCSAALAAGDWQTLARVHNGGPAGARKRATAGYWARVRAIMERSTWARNAA